MGLFKERKNSGILNDPLKPDTADKVLLIDADTIVYAICSGLEYGIDLLPKDMYTKKEYKELTDSPNYDRETNCVWDIDIEQAVILAEEKISKLLTKTGCKSAELYFTSGKNFRYYVTEDYKANRKSTRYPVGLREVKAELAKKYPGDICSEYEADDIVCMLKREHPDKYIVCAVDKDVLRGVAGVHFNYYENNKYKINMKWIKTTEDEATRMPYLQCLMGDSADGIKGVPRIGPKKAEKLLGDCINETELWNRVEKAYQDAGLDIKEAIVNMRLISMHQLTKDKEIELWTSKVKEAR